MSDGATTDQPSLGRTEQLHAQRAVGLAIVLAAFAGIVVVRIWASGDPVANLLHWSGYVAGQSIYVALLAYFVWSLLRLPGRIAYPVVFGLMLTAILVYHGIAAYSTGAARADANRTLQDVRLGQRSIEELTAEELTNPYVEAFVAMRDIYWELHGRADTRMEHYRRLHADYTRDGAFLDSNRLTSSYDLWYAYIQVRDLQLRLQQAKNHVVDLSDLLWAITLLDVDNGTRAAYADDLRGAAAAIAESQAASIAREQVSLAQTRRALEVLIDAAGRFHVDGARIVFDRPEDAARFAGRDAAPGER